MLSRLKVVSIQGVLVYFSFIFEEGEGMSLDDGHFTQFFVSPPFRCLAMCASVYLVSFTPSLLLSSLFLVFCSYFADAQREKP